MRGQTKRHRDHLLPPSIDDCWLLTKLACFNRPFLHWFAPTCFCTHATLTQSVSPKLSTKPCSPHPDPRTHSCPFSPQPHSTKHQPLPSPSAALHPNGVDLQAPPLAQGGPGGPGGRGLGRGLPRGHGYRRGSDGGEWWGAGWVDQGGRQNKRTKLKMKWEGAAFPALACFCWGACVCVLRL